jgi:hypothetical protein
MVLGSESFGSDEDWRVMSDITALIKKAPENCLFPSAL